MSVYYVAPGKTTPAEPHSGYYYVKDVDGNGRICGPFITRPEALDDMDESIDPDAARDDRIDRERWAREEMCDCPAQVSLGDE